MHTLNLFDLAFLGRRSGSTLMNGLISHWNLDETGTSSRLDSHSTKNLNLTDIDGISHAVGLIGNAVEFTDSGAALRYDGDSLTNFRDNSFSIGFWFKLKISSLQYLVFATEIIDSPYIALGYNPFLFEGASLVYSVFDSEGSPSDVKLVGKPLSLNYWHYVCISRNHVNGEMKLRISTTYDWDVEENPEPPFWEASGFSSLTPDAYVNSSIHVGSAYGAGVSNSVIDQLSIWNRVITNEEFLELFNVGLGKAYPFI